MYKKYQHSKQNITDKINQQSLHIIQGTIINIALSGLVFGYLTVYFNAINFQQIMLIFDLKMQKSFGQGLLTSCIPFSACFGAFFSSYILRLFTRKNCFYFINIICIIATIFIQTKIQMLIYPGRILHGIYIGIASSIVPLYIKEFIPELNGKYGIYNQFFITSGLVLAFLFNFILNLLFDNPQLYWRYLFGLPILICLIQIYQIKNKYNYQTPRYLIAQKKYQQAKQLLKVIYKKQFIQTQFEMLNKAVNFHKHQQNQQQLKEEVKKIQQQNQEQRQMKQGTNKLNNQRNKFKQVQQNKQSFIKKQVVSENKDNNMNRNNNILAVLSSFHLAFLQQILGIGFVVQYSGDIVKIIIPQISLIFPILIHSLGMLSTYYGLSLIKIHGRVFLMQFGTIFITIFQLMIAYGFLSSSTNNLAVIIGLIGMRCVFSFTLGPIVWLYIPQIVTPNIVPFATMINWVGATITAFVFPVLTQYFGTPGFIFIFSAVYCGLSFFINKLLLIQTKDKNQINIKVQYQTKLNLIKLKIK